MYVPPADGRCLASWPIDSAANTHPTSPIRTESGAAPPANAEKYKARLGGDRSCQVEVLEDVARSCSPDLILAPSAGDAHQDHRTIGEILPTVFRDQLYLAYEIPKWDGDLGRPSLYVPLSQQDIRHKAELLHKCYPSQRGRDWWDDEVFLGLARLRGMECRARYAEAFGCAKSLLVPTARHDEEVT